MWIFVIFITIAEWSEIRNGRHPEGVRSEKDARRNLRFRGGKLFIIYFAKIRLSVRMPSLESASIPLDESMDNPDLQRSSRCNVKPLTEEEIYS